MIWDFNPVMLMVFASWCLTAAAASMPITLIAGLVLLSSSITFNVLALITLHLVAYLQTVMSSKKSAMVLTQKAYFLRLFGCFVAIYGIASAGSPFANLFIFFGLLLSLPVMPWSMGFSRHYSALTARAYLDTVILPALVTLVVMARIKSDVKMEYDQVWDLTLCITGLVTYSLSAVFAGFSKRVKWTLIHLTQSWLGFALYALVIDANEVAIALLGAVLGFVLLGFRLFDLGSRQPSLYDALARISLLGIPGALSFLVFRQVLPGVVAMNPLWICLIFAVQAFQAYGLIQGVDFKARTSGRPSVQYIIVLLVQFILFVGLIQ